jgi:hypothetical protein
MRRATRDVEERERKTVRSRDGESIHKTPTRFPMRAASPVARSDAPTPKNSLKGFGIAACCSPSLALARPDLLP